MTDKHPVTFSPSERIDAYKELADEFLREILDLPWAFISDESTLSDFCGCGLRERGDLDGFDEKALDAHWDQWVVQRVCERYRVEPFPVSIRMIDLLARIDTVAPDQ